jgi:hypothetical protein
MKTTIGFRWILFLLFCIFQVFSFFKIDGHVHQSLMYSIWVCYNLRKTVKLPIREMQGRASIAYLPLVSKTLYFSMRKFPQNGQTILYTLLGFPYSSSSRVILPFWMILSLIQSEKSMFVCCNIIQKWASSTVWMWLVCACVCEEGEDIVEVCICSYMNNSKSVG